ncbi:MULTISPECIES: hypothetical protein [unclassified Synechococcus]|jgi:hypothetical protein|uniref:hypothetical protein n=1 Tax=unclassified Synechococcus TaxID=2626047 RepID=UPI000B98D986|nr:MULTISPECIES: hypothetical protein [unclassified Synechococcus]MCP9827491.1 hypothetical protein [Synechococcus sp. L2F]MCP9846459.1 hypothetical protein [Synechococcus sp. Lug-A]MCT0209837.1 hypothetical protein [Synechococcus sp. CS-1333]PZV21412.1 MAG: hypothetical protein DCF18_12110 [Cyanobium sp.]
MSYEPGTNECRLLIDSKAQIELALASLAKLENTDHIRLQLLAVYNQLEGLHDLRRAKRPGPIPAGALPDETD